MGRDLSFDTGGAGTLECLLYGSEASAGHLDCYAAPGYQPDQGAIRDSDSIQLRGQFLRRLPENYSSLRRHIGWHDYPSGLERGYGQGPQTEAPAVCKDTALLPWQLESSLPYEVDVKGAVGCALVVEVGNCSRMT